MKVANLNFYDPEGQLIEKRNAETMYVVTEVLKTCQAFNLQADLTPILKKYTAKREQAVTKLVENLAKLSELTADHANYESKGTELEALMGECKELIQQIDIGTILNDIKIEIDAAPANLAHNLELLDLMILVNQGIDFAAKKLKEQYVANPDDVDAKFIKDSPLGDSPEPK